MVDLTLQELSDIVAKIQYEISDKTDWEEPYFLCINTNGDETFIEFLDINIWSDGDDPRDYEDNGYDLIYEPMDIFLRREINSIIQKLSKIKV